MMVVLSAGVLASCNQEVIQDNSYGYLGLKMENDPSADIIVKSGEDDELVFAVDVRNASGQSVASVEDHRTVTSANPIKLQIGYYDVVASNGTDLNAAFDNPYYEGTKNVRIYPDKINTVNLTCTLANSIFSVEFPEEFAEHFEVYEVTVTNGEGNPLVLSNSPQAGNVLEAGFDAKAYLAVTGTLTWNLYLKNVEGQEYRHTMTYSDVKARQHYHLRFNLGEDVSADGAFVVKVTLDNTLDESSHELLLDFDNRYLPSVSSNEEFAVESGQPVTTPVGNKISKVLTFNAPVGIQSLRVSHSDEALQTSGLPMEAELVGASAPDLTPAGIIRKLQYDVYEGKSFISFLYCFPEIRECLGTAGNILELYTWYEAKKTRFFDDCAANFSFNWKEGIKNELDVILTKGLSSLVISCKTAKFNKEHLYEVKYLTDRFSLNSTPVIIYSSTSAVEDGKIVKDLQSVKDRASAMGIHLIDLHTLKGSLGEKLVRIATGEDKP